jgi:hypothetical protein
MLEEISVQPAGRIAQLFPIEAIAAFGTARFDQAAEVIVTEGAVNRFFGRREGHPQGLSPLRWCVGQKLLIDEC